MDNKTRFGEIKKKNVTQLGLSLTSNKTPFGEIKKKKIKLGLSLTGNKTLFGGQMRSGRSFVDNLSGRSVFRRMM